MGNRSITTTRLNNDLDRDDDDQSDQILEGACMCNIPDYDDVDDQSDQIWSRWLRLTGNLPGRL